MNNICDNKGCTQNKMKKINKKLNKFRHIVYRETSIQCTFHPTKVSEEQYRI